MDLGGRRHDLSEQLGHPRRVLGSAMGDTSPNHNSNSQSRNPKFYHVGSLDPLGSYAIYGNLHCTSIPIQPYRNGALN